MLNAMKPVSYPILPRLSYAALWLVALPLLLLLLLARSVRQPAYRHFLRERLGLFAPAIPAPIWVHAASLGEVQAVSALLLRLAQEQSNATFLISCQTPAGRLAAEQLPIKLKQVVYLPFDCGFLVRRFLRAFKPRVALIMETEIWPNLYLAVRRAEIPLLMINARLSARSLKHYAGFGGVFRAALAMPEAIICQSAEDAARFRTAGAPESILSVSGNIKWQAALNEAQHRAAQKRRAGWPQAPIWMAASTHAEETAVVVAIHAQLLKQTPNALLIWAPRHPERFASAVAAARAAGLRVATRAADGEPAGDTQVFVIDTLGELVHFMPGLNAVFVGGSIQAIGGHNVLEPAAAGVPVLVGPHTAHFKDTVAHLAKAGGLIQCRNAEDLQREMLALLADETRQHAMSAANRACIAENAGALEKTKALVSQRLASDATLGNY
jgi:3-deoxy-D-manno-octulosonic-acid transferase